MLRGKPTRQPPVDFNRITELDHELKKLKCRNIVNAIERICPTCGHTNTEDGCAHCLKSELAQNAKRYLWLREMIFDDRIMVAPDRMLRGEALDEAIDLALKSEPEAGS